VSTNAEEEVVPILEKRHLNMRGFWYVQAIVKQIKANKKK